MMLNMTKDKLSRPFLSTFFYTILGEYAASPRTKVSPLTHDWALRAWVLLYAAFSME